MTALEHLLQVLQQEGISSVHIIIDNKSVQVAFQQLLNNALKLPRYGFGRWVLLKQYAANGGVATSWVPSHGKSKLWSPPARGLGSLAQWRALNASADTAATTGLDAYGKQHGLLRVSRESSLRASWAALHLSRLRDSSLSYISSSSEANRLSRRVAHWLEGSASQAHSSTRPATSAG